MTAKGYCEAADVASFLNQTFTAAQLTHCESLIERAETAVDEETRRGWLVGAQTDEKIYYPTCDLWLQYAPVASVEAITGRSGLGEAETALTVDVDYEVISLEWGQIRLVTPGSYDRVQVDYTPVASVPADIVQAVVETVAMWMQPHLQQNSYGIDSIALPDLTVRYARSHVQNAYPPAAQKIIDRYRHPVHA